MVSNMLKNGLVIFNLVSRRRSQNHERIQAVRYSLKVLNSDVMRSLKYDTVLSAIKNLQKRQQNWEGIQSKLYRLQDRYEVLTGLKSVKEAQSLVLQAEKRFVESQSLRRQSLKKLDDAHLRLRDLHSELERISRGDERYLELVKKEVSVMREEKELRSKFLEAEEFERKSFGDLSTALRNSHEKEREQDVRKSYWSIVGSISCAILGALGATINTKYRSKKLLEMVREENATNIGFLDTKISNLATAIENLIPLKGKENEVYMHSWSDEGKKMLDEKHFLFELSPTNLAIVTIGSIILIKIFF